MGAQPADEGWTAQAPGEPGLCGGHDASRAASRLAVELSHHIRTPLTGVVGYTHTLLDRWDELDDPTRRRTLMMVHAEALRLAAGIENVDRRLYEVFADSSVRS